MIVFTDANYSGSLPTFKIVTKNYIFNIRRVLHPSLTEIPVTHNLMQVSVRDFSISNVKNIPQSKTILVVCCKKNKESQGHSVDKEQYAMEKKAYINS